mgnify:CR=1 FL=1
MDFMKEQHYNQNNKNSKSAYRDMKKILQENLAEIDKNFEDDSKWSL